ncbi:MAG TPA: BadF/BadG/BcrA/BcrD ATPase family protein [bacterium]|jgi:N-acetylglucosamine kinase-like BadF-type ATPase|nr:BadF/BadG/BcrA/BcrD ATPase family protein [bacterium]HPG44602.1 BadF/BadG/BcrA/BcrD ATPase family protein [bacterium]HPM97160.1 BadF/BadG/BcrA/BcrD ATPase family protein [bacterium]
MKKFVIGLDGGGTKTKGVLLDSHGALLASAEGESSNIQAVGEEQLERVFSGLIHQLKETSGVEPGEIAHFYAGLAGAGRPADRARISAIVEKLSNVLHYTIDTDAMAALAGAFHGGPGIIIISGTGAICFGKKENGEIVRCGGWGYLLGDEGSGYYLGQQAIIAALKDLDGRGQPTRLRQRIVDFFRLERIELIISPIYSGEIDRPTIASLAPIVFAEAESDDQVAQQIVQTAGHELGKIIAATVRAMGKTGQPVQVALIGSIFKQRDVLIPAMRDQARQSTDLIEFIDPEFEPAVGAALLGLQKEGIVVDASLIRQLHQSIH